MPFIKKKPVRKSGETVVQTARGTEHPFRMLRHYKPLSGAEYCIYESIREAVPIVDAAICKIVRLVGTFHVECPDKSAEIELEKFLNEVKVGPSLYGINSFTSTFLDQILTYGTAVGEMIIDDTFGGIAALYNANLKDVEVKVGENPLEALVCAKGGGTEAVPVPFQDRILLAALNPQPGEATGTSILKGLPFVTSILLKIFNSIGTNWDRVGNLRFAVTYKPPEGGLEAAMSGDRAAEIAKEWSAAMNDDGAVQDFVAVGDVDIKVIGADNQILDSSVPVRHMLEQIVSKLGLPPFMLGLSWSTTERMSAQQADILTSELEAYRRLLNPVISKICRRFLMGRGGDFEIIWDDISLQDEVELANAALIRAQTKKIEEELGGTKE